MAILQLLVDLHGGEVPASMEALEALPGVGHKTARWATHMRGALLVHQPQAQLVLLLW